MCGITGVFSLGTDIPKMKDIVENIVRDQYPRGPDNQKVEVIHGRRACTILGHDRLSIIDLSPEAHQPMWDLDHRYCLVFNGEIYNYIELRAELIALGHVFKTHSDSEVILEAFKEWGIKGIIRFNGMFSFAVLDTLKEKLYMFRDRFGVKPLYYVKGDKEIYFASTSVISKYLGLSPELTYVAQGLHFGFYDEGDASPFVGLLSLKPGHYLEAWVSDTHGLNISVKEYYRLEENVLELSHILADTSQQVLVEKVAYLLEDSVSVRLRADVPVGVSLSGGLDSSTIAALSNSSVHDLRGFTFGNAKDSWTEGPLAKAVTDHLGITLNFVNPGIDEIKNAYFEALNAQGAPFPSGSILAQYLVYKTARQNGVKVLLGGQGGDEIFMGYRKYLVFYLKQLFHQGQYQQALAFCISLTRVLTGEMRQASVYWRERHRYTQKTGRKSILRLPTRPNRGLGFDPSQPLWIRQMQDVSSTSLPALLRYEDRNSMGNSVESRLPFIDYRLVEVALALPASMKLRHGYGKWIVREMVKGRVPDLIRLAHYKRGFDVRQNDWLANGLGEAIRVALQERFSIIKEWLDPNATVEALFSDTELQNRPLAFAEATTLIWLGDQM